METSNDIAASIRQLKEIELEDCAVIIRALSCRLASQQRGFRVTEFGNVVCAVEMAQEQLDLCADLVSEAAEMEAA